MIYIGEFGARGVTDDRFIMDWTSGDKNRLRVLVLARRHASCAPVYPTYRPYLPVRYADYSVEQERLVIYMALNYVHRRKGVLLIIDHLKGFDVGETSRRWRSSHWVLLVLSATGQLNTCTLYVVLVQWWQREQAFLLVAPLRVLPGTW